MAPADAGEEHSYPIVLYLCGSGQCGTDNFKQAVFDTGLVDKLAKNTDDMYSCIVIAPQLPEESLALNDEILAGYMGLVESVQKRYNADADRVYLVGFSMGGDSIWALLERYPEKIAAAAPICGGLFDIAQADKMKSVPIWAFHGKLDYLYPAKNTRNMVEELKTLGGNVRYTEYWYAAHVCWQWAYSEPELLSWMFSQKRS
jgi:predicted peptidase